MYLHNCAGIRLADEKIQLVLMGNNILTSVEFATGYSTGDWDDKMHILINLSSCGTLLGQAWSKTAFGVTLLRMSNSWQRAIIWFCLISMNSYMLVKVFFQWAKYCGKDDYQQWYRIQGFCINYNFEQNFKEGGNGKHRDLKLTWSETRSFTNYPQSITSSWTLF